MLQEDFWRRERGLFLSKSLSAPLGQFFSEFKLWDDVCLRLDAFAGIQRQTSGNLLHGVCARRDPIAQFADNGAVTRALLELLDRSASGTFSLAS